MVEVHHLFTIFGSLYLIFLKREKQKSMLFYLICSTECNIRSYLYSFLPSSITHILSQRGRIKKKTLVIRVVVRALFHKLEIKNAFLPYSSLFRKNKKEKKDISPLHWFRLNVHRPNISYDRQLYPFKKPTREVQR